MPQRAKHPCAYPGCPNTIREGRYCPAHKTIASREYDKAHRNPKNYDHRWKLIRDCYVAKHPLCEHCLAAGRLVPVDLVHHIKPIEEGGDHSDENLTSLCRSCHGKLHNTL